MLRFIHTADWQLGKPYASVENPDKRRDLQRARLDAVTRLGELARAHDARFVLVAGDLFDSTTPEKSLVAQACAAIGKIGLPVFVIPGNHDHGGPGGVWTQEFFLAEQREHAPNLRVLLSNERVELPGGGHLFPCPLLTRHDTADTTAHLRAVELPDDSLPRIVLAHGSASDFGSDAEDRANNRIAWDRLVTPPAGSTTPRFDYLALGDWHGMKQLSPRVWYSGTHEPDRFPKNADYESGFALLVSLAQRGATPEVEPLPCSCVAWRSKDVQLTAGDSTADALADVLPDAASVGKVALRLSLSGETGFAGMTTLRERLDRLDARVALLDLDNRVRLRPSDEEIASLAERPGDPLLSRVARELLNRCASGDPVAAHALGELHAAVMAASH